MIPQKQLSLADIFEDCNDIFKSDKPQFLSLLENHIDLDEIVPISFYNHGRSLIHNVISFIYQYAVTGYSLQTWYMPSLLFGIIIVSYLFGYPRKEKLLFGTFVLSTLILLCGKSYYCIVSKNKIIDWLINIGLISLIRFIPFIVIGVYFACKKELNGRKTDFVYWLFWGLCSIIKIQILKLNK